MGVIRILPPHLINRIAAGECVERPASVVKELVENALDAGANRIEISLRDGGRELIQVSDDGGGMEPDDLLLAVEQHATSKIHADDDLFNIHTMGFRGEALASIASIARVELTSRRRTSDVAYRLRVEGGAVHGPPAPCAAPPGTTVAVRDLFFCVPARRKFLKTSSTEVGHVSEQTARIALAHPQVEFVLRNQERVTHRLAPTSDPRRRIGDFFGEELARVLLPVRRAGQDVVVDALVAPPAESRGSGKWEYLFVNGRFVRDRFVSHAVKEAYRSLIDPGRYPVTFIYITIEPAQVDVNVHPTKTEVRWRDSNYVHGQVLAALRERFQTTRLDHAWRAPRPAQTTLADGPPGDADEYRERARAAMLDFFRTAGPTTGGRPAPAAPAPGSQPDETPPARVQPRNDHSSITRRTDDASSPRPPERLHSGHADGGTQPHAASPTTAPSGPLSASETKPLSAASAPAARVAPPAAGSAPASATSFETPSPMAPRYRALQVHNSYLAVETEEGLMLIDQHALHERILYEELRARITTRTLESQRLLLPEIVRVPADRLEALEGHAETLARLGIELSAAGPASVAVQAFPTLLLNRLSRHITEFVRDLLDLLGERGARPAEDTLLHEVLDMMACKAAVKAGDPLTVLEIDALLARRETAERSSHCPHGRPTTLHLTLRDLERQFRRR